jgi:hypothetical protein
MKKEFGDCTNRLSLCVRASSSGDGCSRSRGILFFRERGETRDDESCVSHGESDSIDNPTKAKYIEAPTRSRIEHFTPTIERQKLGSTSRTRPSKLLKQVTLARSDVLFKHTHQVVINRSVRINRLATAWVASVPDADGVFSFIRVSNAVRS